ncbi:MAG: methionine adenosyltransferase [Planctomycetes bacterium]|nr:methionine adenosyltransferase [Planctomycetota bacterium]
MSSTKKFLFTSESVSMGHPDKVADQISDAILDHCLAADPTSRVACETMVTTDLAIVSGEITTKADLSREVVDRIIRDMVRAIGYVDPSIGFAAKTMQVHINLHSQSPDISMGVDVGGAGDQGMMFGFACRETKTLMPLPIYLSHRLVENHARLREKGEIKFLRPDAKSQVTVEYNGDGTPNRIHTVVISTQHDRTAMDAKGLFSNDARSEIIQKLILPTLKAERPDLMKGELVSVMPGQSSANVPDSAIRCHINPTGNFEMGGPHGDCGLTGRKIIVDTYGGRGRHGGGAFSGKDPTKVDRSAAYMARYIAKNIVAAGLAEECEVQLSYAIGYPDPLNIWVNTNGTTAKGLNDDLLVELIRKNFQLTPKGIIESLNLRRPIYRETARDGHFGRELPNFTWEKTDKAAALKKEAGL